MRLLGGSSTTEQTASGVYPNANDQNPDQPDGKLSDFQLVIKIF